ncbi:VCBS domain-containing protein [Synechococcus sp. WH 8020]|uniref:VCBS domain-containing protein n=1 Tax=Synechococcus sp. (strain WH8020) TaxID=32052 RepID=UPI00069F55C0|nr:VCBS domain-containing protein [Synechococcus sp. WH 8020]
MPENVNSIDRSILLEELEAAGVIDSGDVLTSTRDQEITANQRNRLKGGDGDDHYIGEDGKKESFIFDGRNDNRDEGRHVNVISHFSFHDQDRLRIRLDGGFFQTDDGNNLAQSSDGDHASFQTARDIADLLLHINRKDGIQEGIGEDLTISPDEIEQQTREKNGKVKGQFRRELKQQQIEGSYVEIVGNHLVINLDDGDGSGETVDKWGNYKTDDVMLVYENFNEKLASQLASEFGFDATDFSANEGSIKIEDDSGDVLSSGLDDSVFILGNAASTIRINSEQSGGANSKKINIIYGFDLDADTVIIDNDANYFTGIESNSFKEFIGKDGIGELIAAASSFEQTGSDLVVELRSLTEEEESIVVVFVNTDINDIPNGGNVAPVINPGESDLAGSVTEDDPTANVATGAVIFSDVDVNDTHTASFSGTASYGTFALGAFSGTTDGIGGSQGWSYSLDNTNPAVQALGVGETLSETFTITVDDGNGGTASQDVSVTVTGTNDAPTVTEATDVTGAVTELADLDVNEGSAALTDSGSFAIADVDLSDVQSVSVTASTTTSTETADASTTLGSLTATVSDNTTADGTGAVSWTYSVADSAVDYLAAGQTISETFTITVADDNGGTASQDVSVTVTGTNDQPVAAAVAINATEDGPTVIGNFTETDADSTDSHTFAIGSWTQIGEDIDGEAAGDFSGTAVALSGDGSVVAIGAASNDGNGGSSGQVRLYRNTGGNWTQIGADIDGETAFDESGTSVALSGDGSVVAIGAPLNDPVGNASGHVRLYRNTGDSWTQIGEDIDGEVTSEQSGFSVSLSENGNVVAIGARWRSSRSGQVRLYQLENDNWTQLGDDIDEAAAGDESGTSVSLSADGSVVAIGAPFNDDNGNNSGQVRLYQLENDSWTQIGDNIDGEAAGDESGTSLALSADGSVVAIGAYLNDGNGSNSGQVRLYRNENGSWTQIGDDIDGEGASDLSGNSVSLSADGNVVAIGANKNDGNGGNSGHVRLYQNVNDSWTQIGADIDGEAALDESGWSVSLSADGSVVAIGARFNDGNGSSSGQVRMYQLEGLNITGEPAEGSIVNNNDGTFSFDPGSDFQDLAEGETRDVTFTYTATDDSGAGNATSDPATATITVTGSNDAPVINPGGSDLTGEVTEDGVDDQGNETPGISSASGALLADDVDGATQTWSILGTPSETYGTFELDEFGFGDWTFTLDNESAATQALQQDEEVVELFSVRATDEFGAFVDQEISITIRGANDDDSTDPDDSTPLEPIMVGDIGNDALIGIDDEEEFFGGGGDNLLNLPQNFTDFI